MYVKRTLPLLLSIITIAISTLEYNVLASTILYDHNNIGVKPGYWVKYLGTIPPKNCNWINLSVLMVKDDNLTLRLSCEGHEQIIQVNITANEGAYFPFIIPSNLGVGDNIPTTDLLLNLNITEILIREYAGSQREVTYAFTKDTPWNFPTEFYWDRKTGIILEVSLIYYRPHTILKAIETNIWPENPFITIKNGSIFYIPGIIITLISIFSYYIYKEETGPSNKFLFKIYLNFDNFLILVGAIFLVLGILCIAPEKQELSSISFLLAFPLVLIGFYLKSEIWIGASILEKFSHFLILLSMILLNYVAVASLYSEVAIEVPIEIVIKFTPSGVTKVTMFREVYVHPFAWLATPLISISLPTMFLGVLLKLRESQI